MRERATRSSYRGLSASYNALYDAMDFSMTLWKRKWFPSVQSLLSLPDSPLEACSRIFQHWSKKSRGPEIEGVFTCVEIVQYIYDCLESGIGISVPVMDACVGALSITLDSSQLVLPARDIGLFKEGWSEFCRSISALFQAEHSGPVSKSPTSMQYNLKEFRTFCAQRPELQNCVDTVKRFISGKEHSFALIPFFLSAAPRNESPGMGHWVTIQLEFSCRPKRMTSEWVVQNSYMSAGDSLAPIRNSFSSLKDMDLILLHLLCAAVSSAWPCRLKNNITLDKAPKGCSLPLQAAGNGCAVFILATICAASSLSHANMEMTNEDNDGVDILPFDISCFDGKGEVLGRRVLASIGMVRLYQFGKFVQWGRNSQRGKSLMAMYLCWERQEYLRQSAAPEDDTRFVQGEVIFQGEMKMDAIVEYRGDFGARADESLGSRRKFELSDSFRNLISGGIRK
jgi:hypothetical protein